MKKGHMYIGSSYIHDMMHAFYATHDDHYVSSTFPGIPESLLSKYLNNEVYYTYDRGEISFYEYKTHRNVME